MLELPVIYSDHEIEKPEIFYTTSSIKVPEWYEKLGNDHFFPHVFKITVHRHTGTLSGNSTLTAAFNITRIA
jgi:hypothetical protein